MDNQHAPMCPRCYENEQVVVMDPRIENNGYVMPAGPEHVEIIGFVCPQCGFEN